jgi:hypothetical protein
LGYPLARTGPIDAARDARRKRIGIEERADSFWHGEHALQATAFPKEHRVQQGEVVDNKRLSAALDFIKDVFSPAST